MSKTKSRGRPKKIVSKSLATALVWMDKRDYYFKYELHVNGSGISIKYTEGDEKSVEETEMCTILPKVYDDEIAKLVGRIILWKSPKDFANLWEIAMEKGWEV